MSQRSLRKRLLRGRVNRNDGSDGEGTPDTGAVGVASRSAVLLRGGLHPSQIARTLFREEGGIELRAAAEQVEGGASFGAALATIDGPDWRVLGAAWNLAERSGAPFVQVLDRIASALRSIEELGRRREVLLAAPRMTTRLVAWLPLAAIGVGVVLGFDPIPVFLTPLGAVLLAIGLLMQLLGLRWTRWLIARVEAEVRVAALECELMWVALSGGASPGIARVRVADAVSDARAEWVELSGLRRGGRFDRALQQAVDVGVSPSLLLLDVASAERGELQSGLERGAERLGIRILIPLATCILPAFIVLGVLPVIATLLGDVLVLPASL